jgi:hypothetical protein
MDPLGSRHVRGLVARNRHGLSRLCGSSRHWPRADNVDRIIGEFLERETAMRRVEELVESSMMLALHDWDLYQAAKGKR